MERHRFNFIQYFVPYVIQVSLAKPPSDKKKKEEVLRARERRMLLMMQGRTGVVGLVKS